ncbi:MAG: prepilin-type N-terminal cleavage/methylation domain-containing protein [Phycisphaerales bacterium]
MKSRVRFGFTLIELLVVIAIIALLISILLPAVGKMKKVGWMTKSRANLRSICTAAASYANDQKGFYPITAPKPSALYGVPSIQPNGPRGMAPEYYTNAAGQRQITVLSWLCTWTFGGKDCSGYWLTSSQLGAGDQLDLEAKDRPLNAYVTDAAISEPPPGQPFGSTNEERLADKLPVFRDPSDKLGHQENWPGPNTYVDPLLGRVASCYESVGTSYQFNLKWHEFLMAPPPGRSALGFTPAFWTGCRMIKAGDTFSPSRFCWVHDEYADIVVYNTDPNYKIKNGYGDVNRSIMGFLDGHVNYLETFPGRHQNPVGGVGQSYSNGMYTFVFDGYR